MPEEEIKQINEESVEETITDEEGKQKSKIGKFFSSVGSKAISAVKAGATFVKDKTVTAYDKHQEIQKNNKMFEDASIKFTISSEKIQSGDFSDIVQFYAIKSMQDHSLLVRIDTRLTVNTVIVSNEGQFRITDIDSKTEIDFPVDNSSQYPIKCYKCLYEAYKKEPASPVVNNTINQSNVIHGDNYGDVTQIATQQDDLDKIESEIQKYKPKLLHKGKKEEALILFGNFKNCVLEKKKDKSLFDKFLDVLKIVAPAVVSIATALIAAL